MASIANLLPFGDEPDADERGAADDRRAEVGDAVTEAARILAETTDENAEHCARARRFLDESGLGTGAAGGSPADLFQLAKAIRAGRPRSTRLLAQAVRALLVLGDAIGAEPDLEPAVWEATARHAATTAPPPRRATVRGHTLRAADQGWSFGYGPTLQGTGRGIVRYLLVLDDDPPRQISSRR